MNLAKTTRAFIVNQKNSARVFPDEKTVAEYLNGPQGYQVDETTSMLRINLISDEELERLSQEVQTAKLMGELQGSKGAYLEIIKLLARSEY